MTSARQRQSSRRLISVASIARDRLAAHADAVEPRGDHLGVVDHQRVAGAQEIGQVGDAGVRQRAVRADDEHPRAVARRRRRERDALGRKLEVEERRRA